MTITPALEEAFKTHVFPAQVDGRQSTTVAVEDIGDMEIIREGDRVFVRVPREHEKAVHRLFGFGTDQLDKRQQVVTGFRLHRETDTHVSLVIRRPFLYDQYIKTM